MFHLRLLSVVLTAALLAACAQEAAQDTPEPTDPETAAVQSAERWLALVDEGKYEASWNEAATMFKSAVQKEQWSGMMDGGRAPLGKLVERKVASKSYQTSVPGAPDGEYVIIQFQSAFENKADAIETVTPMKDEDGSWRVSGYYIN